MNFVHLTGRLGADPKVVPYKSKREPEREPQNRFLAKFDLAVDQPWRPGGEKSQKPDWVSVVAFDGPSARFVQKALSKGDAISLSGRLQTDEWETENGEKRHSLFVAIIEIEKQKGRGSESSPVERETEGAVS